MSLTVQADHLKKNYAGEEALKGVSISVRVGSLYGLIGADGAGKTTLLRILTTLVNPDKGTAMILGKNSTSDFREIRTRIGYMPQKFSLYADLTVKENLMFFADIFGVHGKEREERMKRLLAFSRLEQFQKRRAQNLSGGMKQKLALSCILVHTPQLLFLDEPTIGVDPVSRKEFWDILQDLKKQGITIVVSTPYMDEAQLCDELAIMHRGAIIAQGAPADLTATYPHALYAVSAPGPMLTVPRGIALPAGIALMYPAEGTLHTAAHSSEPESEILKKVQAILPQAVNTKRISPKIEDLFIHLLSRESNG